MIITFLRSDTKHIYYDGEEIYEWLGERAYPCSWQNAVRECQANLNLVTADGAELVDRLSEALSNDEISDFADAGTISKAVDIPKSGWPGWLRERMRFLDDECRQTQFTVDSYLNELKERIQCL